MGHLPWKGGSVKTKQWDNPSKDRTVEAHLTSGPEFSGVRTEKLYLLGISPALKGKQPLVQISARKDSLNKISLYIYMCALTPGSHHLYEFNYSTESGGEISSNYASLSTDAENVLGFLPQKDAGLFCISQLKLMGFLDEEQLPRKINVESSAKLIQAQLAIRDFYSGIRLASN